MHVSCVKKILKYRIYDITLKYNGAECFNIDVTHIDSNRAFTRP